MYIPPHNYPDYDYILISLYSSLLYYFIIFYRPLTINAISVYNHYNHSSALIMACASPPLPHP